MKCCLCVSRCQVNEKQPKFKQLLRNNQDNFPSMKGVSRLFYQALLLDQKNKYLPNIEEENDDNLKLRPDEKFLSTSDSLMFKVVNAKLCVRKNVNPQELYLRMTRRGIEIKKNDNGEYFAEFPGSNKIKMILTNKDYLYFKSNDGVVFSIEEKNGFNRIDLIV